MQEETITTELESEETDSQYAVVSDTPSTGEDTSLVEDTSDSDTDIEDSSEDSEEDVFNDKELAVTDLESKVTINTLAENQEKMIENQENTNSLLGGLLFAMIFFVGAYLIIMLGKWLYHLIRC